MEFKLIHKDEVEGKIALKENYDDIEEELGKQRQRMGRYKDQVVRLETQVEEIAEEMFQKNERIARLQEDSKRKENRIAELMHEKKCKEMNQKTYCNLIRRILRSQIDIEEFEEQKNFEELLEKGSKKVMEERKRQR